MSADEKEEARSERFRCFVRWLQSYTLFRGMTAEEVERILRLGVRRRMRRVDTIFQEGTVEESFYLILEGSVAITQNVGGQEQHLATLEEGHCFGEVGILQAGPRTASAAARSDGLLLVVDRKAAEGLGPELSLKFYRNLALTLVEKLAIANSTIDRLTTHLREVTSAPRPGTAGPA